ncbi:MAG: DNA-directed RNA polymerase subunit omega [Gammaproteobacteria bacterium]|jgi:DNA-directed RNA polymerase subunit omega|nr:DNA-directed RNA polymerase subunit omega [Gammaproteobacteria bacterium]
MARVTVEDCLDRIPNQFELTLVAAKRARQLARGAEAKLPWGNHKSTVLSLKEIAHGFIDTGVLQEADLPAIQQPKMELEALDPSFDL